MNWGYKILAVYIVFVAGILFMVFRSSGEKTDLVTPDYYAQELRFQEKIDQEKHTRALYGSVRYELKDQQLSVYFPADFKGKKISGKATLYYPADQNLDVEKNFSITDTPLSIDIPGGIINAFELQLNWNVEGVDYYFKEKIYR